MTENDFILPLKASIREELQECLAEEEGIQVERLKDVG